MGYEKEQKKKRGGTNIFSGATVCVADVVHSKGTKLKNKVATLCPVAVRTTCIGENRSFLLSVKTQSMMPESEIGIPFQSAQLFPAGVTIFQEG